MRRTQRLIAAAILAAMSVTLAGCGGGTFDPTDLMDWFDTKKKIPGERKPVFPEGVPGVEQGVPRELYKGAQQQEPPPPVAEAPPAPEPRAKRSAPKSTARSAPRSVAPAQDGPDADEGAAAAPPAPPPPARPKRQRITAPPPDPAPPPQQQQAAPPAQSSPTPFPAPLPSGSFSR